MNQVILELKKQIASELEYCNPNDTPWLCAQISDKEGYDKIEQLIIELVCGEAMSISSSIVQIEQLYNPNRLD